MANHNYHNFGTIWTEILDNSPAIINKVRWNPQNGEVVAIGGLSTVFHFNGMVWNNLASEFSNTMITFNSLFLTNEYIFIVGNKGIEASIIMGERK